MITKLISSVAIIMGVLMVAASLVALTPDNSVYAWELVGDDTGLHLVPSAMPLFDLENMYPGDSDTAIITVSNQASEGKYFTANFHIDKTGGSDKADLYDQLLLTIVYGDNDEYSGPMSEFEGLDLGSFAPDTSKELYDQLLLTIVYGDNDEYSGPMSEFEGLDLGTFYSGNSRNLFLTVELPGPETGNEFQGADLDIELIFTARGEEESADPEEPRPPFIPLPPGEVEVPDQEPFTEPEEEVTVDPEPPEGAEVGTDEPDEQAAEDILIIDPDAPEGRGELPRTDGGGFIGLLAGIMLITLGLVLRKKGRVKA